MAFEADLYPDEYFDNLHNVTPFAAPERKWRERDRDILRLARPSPEKIVLEAARIINAKSVGFGEGLGGMTES